MFHKDPQSDPEWKRTRKVRNHPEYGAPWPLPLLSFAVRPDCLCAITYAPDITRNSAKPFALKFAHKDCQEGHYRAMVG